MSRLCELTSLEYANTYWRRFTFPISRNFVIEPTESWSMLFSNIVDIMESTINIATKAKDPLAAVFLDFGIEGHVSQY